MKATIGTLAACLMALHTNRAAAEADASAIFASLEPSLVAVTNAEGGGSGVVLSESGLILTNFHVANTPLPLSVEAFVSVVLEQGFEKVQHGDNGFSKKYGQN